MLKVKDLNKNFGGISAVKDCNFRVQKNSITALIGPNGAGKSTVFNSISGNLKPSSGNIIFKEKDIVGLPIHKVSKAGISHLFQESRLFPNLTVRENLLLALDTEDQKFWKNLIYNRNNKDHETVLREFLNLVDLGRFEEKKTKNLSYGQQRLIELIRSILSPHSFLMLDEPVAGVNPVIREKIISLLLDLKEKGETILLAEHDIDFIFNVADTIIVMHEGRVMIKGTSEEISKNPKVLELYLGK